jgi:hypothetical protein
MAILRAETCCQYSVTYQQLYVVFDCAHLSTLQNTCLKYRQCYIYEFQITQITFK